MSLLAVTGEAGPGWAAGGIYEQPGAQEHASFLNGLADEGFVSSAARLPARSAGVSSCSSRRQLATSGVESWTILVGAEGLPASVRAAP